MDGEVCTFLDAFDAENIIVKDPRKILEHKISLVMFTDSDQVFDALIRG